MMNSSGSSLGSFMCMKVSQMNIQMDEEEVYVGLLYFIRHLYVKISQRRNHQDQNRFKHIKSVLFRGENTAQRKDCEN